MTKGDKVLCLGCFGKKTQTVQDPKTGEAKKVECPACKGTGKRS